MRSKEWIAFIVCLVFASGVASGVGLRNPSFEESLDPEDPQSDKAAAWGRWGHWINRETGWSPTKSGECLIGYHHYRIEEDGNSGIFQDVEGVLAGKSCTFSIFVYKDTGTKVENIELRLEPRGGGEVVASETYRNGDLKQGTWTQLTVKGTAPAEGVRVLLVVTPKKHGTRSGALKFDDAQMVQN